jgi:hypothetical protein
MGGGLRSRRGHHALTYLGAIVVALNLAQIAQMGCIFTFQRFHYISMSVNSSLFSLMKFHSRHFTYYKKKLPFGK